jgi:hypothetical protein
MYIHMGVAPGPASQDAVITRIYASSGIQWRRPRRAGAASNSLIYTYINRVTDNQFNNLRIQATSIY